MKRSFVVSLCALLVLASAAMGDVRPVSPDELPQPERIVAPVVVKRGALREERNVQAKIQIPRHLVGAGDFGAAAPTGAAAPAPGDQGGGPAIITIIAGLAMSLAAVSFVFVLRGNRKAKAVALVATTGAVLLGAWSMARADIPVPDQPRPATGPQIVIEFLDEGESVTLLLPR